MADPIKLPDGYTLDGPAPTPPVGYTLDGSTNARGGNYISDFGNAFWEGIGGKAMVDVMAGANHTPEGAKKTRDTVRSFINGLANEPGRVWSELKQSGQAMVNGEAGNAASHLAGAVPLFGAAAQNVQHDFENGDYAKGFGHALGLLLPVAAPHVLQGTSQAAGAASEHLYRTSLNPRITTPVADVRQMVKTGLENSIPVSEAGAQKLHDLVLQLNDQGIGPKVNAAAARGVTVDPVKVAQRLDSVEKQFGIQVNPEADLKAINASGDEFLRNNQNPMPADQAQAMKVGTYQQIAAKEPAAFGKMTGRAQIESQKALARGIKEELATQIPELASLNAKEGALLDLQPVLERAVTTALNRKGGLGPVLTAGVAEGVTGSPAVAVASGVLKSVLNNPGIRSRLAILVREAQVANPAKFGTPSMTSALARVDAYLASLEQQPQQ